MHHIVWHMPNTLVERMFRIFIVNSKKLVCMPYLSICLPETDFKTILKDFFVVQSLSPVQLFATPWIAGHQPSLTFTISWGLLKLMSIESVMPPNHLILCHPVLLLPSVFSSIWVFSNESALCIRWPKDWSFSIC